MRSTSSALPCSTIRPEIHHCNIVRQVLDHRKIVGDEQVGNTQLALQFFQQIEIRDGVAKDDDVPAFAGRIYDETQRMIALVGISSGFPGWTKKARKWRWK